MRGITKLSDFTGSYMPAGERAERYTVGHDSLGHNVFDESKGIMVRSEENHTMRFSTESRAQALADILNIRHNRAMQRQLDAAHRI